MVVLRRRADNVMHLVAFGVLALAVGFGRSDVVGLVIAAALAVLAVRGYRAGVYVGPDDVVVRDTFRSRRVRRADIMRADIDPRASMVGPATVLVTNDGTKIPLWSLQPGRKKGTKLHAAHVTILKEVQQALGLTEAV